MNYVGIDHHRQYSHIIWLDEKGEVVKTGRVENLFTDKGMKVLKGLALPEREAKLVGSLLRTYDHLEERINETNALVKQVYEKMPSAQLIQTVPGFGIFLAVLVAVEAIWPALRADFDIRGRTQRKWRQPGGC